MSIGAAVRSLAGPLEPAFSDWYRGLFYDVDDFAARVNRIAPGAHIVDVGAGEGAVAAALIRGSRTAKVVGVDPSPKVGRLYREDPLRARFVCGSASSLLAQYSGRFDVALLGDVLHHVPPEDEGQVWAAAAGLVRPGGFLVLKEWVRSPSLRYWAGWFSDRVLTGDKVRYRSREEWHLTGCQYLGTRGFALVDEWVLSPAPCNHAWVFERQSCDEVAWPGRQ
jgi:hypothetical protein